MNRLDRLQAILTTLQSKKVVTAEYLSKKFEVSVRTIYRDIRSLEEGGIPIGAEAGIGYYILDGFSLPPIMFTHEEARALLLAGKMVEKFSDSATSKIYSNALTKIQAVLDSSKKEELDDLNNKIIVMPYRNENGNTDFVLNLIKEALVKSLQITFNYTSNSEKNLRTADPLGLCFYGNNWHLIAFCHLRNDYRDFRTDRISDLKVTTTRFKTNKYLSISEYFEKLIADTDLIKTKIKVNESVAKHITNTKYQMGFIKEEHSDNGIIMEFATYGINYFSRWMLMLGDSVEIIEPVELIEKTKELIGELHFKYNKI